MVRDSNRIIARETSKSEYSMDENYPFPITMKYW